MPDIVTIGTATCDVFLESKDFKFIESDEFRGGVGECLALGSKNEVNDIFFSTGGGATNAAVTFARLGLKTATIVRVGNDPSGDGVMRTLKEEKVDTRFIEHDREYGTAYSTLLMHGPGERTVLVYRGASMRLSLDALRSVAKEGGLASKIVQSKWLYITSLGGNLDLLRQIWQLAKKHEIKIAWNPGGEELKYGLTKLASFIRQCEVFNLNKEEAARLTSCEPQDDRCFVGKLQNLAAITLITDGKRGAYCYLNLNKRQKISPELVEGSNSFFAPSLGTKPRNTTGAGDAFGSAFVAGLILDEPEVRRRGKTLSFGLRLRQKLSVEKIKSALRLAILNADSVIQHMGAKTGILKKLPTKAQLTSVRIKNL